MVQYWFVPLIVGVILICYAIIGQVKLMRLVTHPEKGDFFEFPGLAKHIIAFFLGGSSLVIGVICLIAHLVK